MITFEQEITTAWGEVLHGASDVSFDVLQAPSIFVRFTEGVSPADSDEGNRVGTFPNDWDFSALGMASGQKIWLKTETGVNAIRGVR